MSYEEWSREDLDTPYYKALVSSRASFKSYSTILQFPNTIWKASIFHDRSALLCILVVVVVCGVGGELEGGKRLNLVFK